jgi:DNA-binding NarL/FixJ family response regulator
MNSPDPQLSREPAVSPPGARDRRIAVLVVDDHPAVRRGVRRLLCDQPDMRVVAEAPSAARALDAAASGVEVAVVDYHLGDRNGLWLAERLRRLEPSPRVLVYSAFSDDALAVAAVVAGVDGLLSKSAIGDELCVAVRRIAAGDAYLPRISMTVARAMSVRVDPRLRPVFGMLVQGIATDDVRRALQLSADGLEVARAEILGALAPAMTRGRPSGKPRAALSYERPHRRRWLGRGSV